MATTSDPAPLAPEDLSLLPPGGRWYRITAERFPEPLGWGPGESRFVPPGARWGGVYLAEDVVTGFREAVLRDRGVDGGGGPVVTAADLTGNSCVGVVVPADLRVVDLVDGPLGMLLNTDARSARRSPHPGLWSAAWRDDPLAPEGILYPSRFTGRRCLFVWDRSVARLAVPWRRRLDHLDDPLASELAGYLRRLLDRAARLGRSP